MAMKGSKMRNMAQHSLNYMRPTKCPKHTNGLLTWIRFLLWSVLNYDCPTKSACLTSPLRIMLRLLGLPYYCMYETLGRRTLGQKFNATFQWHRHGADVDALGDGARFCRCVHVMVTVFYAFDCNCLFLSLIHI